MTIREKLIADRENNETILATAPAAIRKEIIVGRCARHLTTEIWNERTTLEEAKNRFAEWCKAYMAFKLLAATFGEKINIDFEKGVLWFKHPEKARWMPMFA